MIRFFLYLLLVLTAYLIFYITEEYNFLINIVTPKYIFTSNVIFFILAQLLIIIISLLILNCINFLLSLPKKIYEKYHSHKIKKDNLFILNYFTDLILEKKKFDIISLKKIQSNMPELSKYISIILYEISNNSDERISYLQDFLQYSPNNLSAKKKILTELIKQKSYSKALLYAKEINNYNDTDPEILVIFLEIYSNLDMLEKLLAYIDKLEKLFPKYFQNNVNRITEYLVNFLERNITDLDQEKQIAVLETILLYDPINLKSIDLLCKIHFNNSKKEIANHIILEAFSLKPSYELFKNFLNMNISVPPEEIYDIFINKIDKYNEENYILIAQIALSLKLENKFKELINQKL